MPARHTTGAGLTARGHWREYALGLLTEIGFVVALSLVALVLALVANVVFR